MDRDPLPLLALRDAARLAAGRLPGAGRAPTAPTLANGTNEPDRRLTSAGS
jgi:hypothetical protein